ncbi:hypothetical protein [Coleofasciculus sp.]
MENAIALAPDTAPDRESGNPLSLAETGQISCTGEVGAQLN